MRPDLDRLLSVLTSPDSGAPLNDAHWRALIPMARNANLLGKLAATLEASGRMPTGNPSRHLIGAVMLSRRQQQSVTWESHKIDAALADLGRPVLLLKGAAYAIGGLAPAKGRLFGDIDILVSRDAIDKVEMQLMINGWTSMKLNAYDQRYYRQWMHEIPPMMHVRRGTVIDVHHTILPLTARYQPKPECMFARAIALPGYRCLMIPSTEDLVVHSCCHLVHEGEVDNALRDMHDIAGLLQSNLGSGDFVQRLVEAATDHDLVEPTALALRLVHHYFRTPGIPDILDGLGASRWDKAHTALVSRYGRAIRPSEESDTPWATLLARQLIYLRAHRLRMPAAMLIRHLARKAWMQLKPDATQAAPDN